MNPQYVNIGANDDKVIEECAEVIQAIIKKKDSELMEKFPVKQLSMSNQSQIVCV